MSQQIREKSVFFRPLHVKQTNPVKVRCRESELPLGSWTRQNLDWYSGRAIYSTTFETETSLPSTAQVKIDLGKVCYRAEVWVNGKHASARISV